MCHTADVGVQCTILFVGCTELVIWAILFTEYTIVLRILCFCEMIGFAALLFWVYGRIADPVAQK